MKLRIAALALALVALNPFSTQAQTFVDYTSTVGGSTDRHQWTDFVRPGGVSSGTSGTAGQWAAAGGIAANGGSTTDLVFVPLSGPATAQFASDTTDFLSDGDGIYTFFSQSHFTVGSTSPLDGLKTLVLQIDMTSGLADPFNPNSGLVDYANGPTLTLSISGGPAVTNLAATFSLVESSVPVSAGGFESFTKVTGFQWDLSGVTGTITGYTVNFQTGYHGTFIGADMVESTATNASSILTAVPEPSTYLLMALGFVVLALMKWYRSQRRTTIS